MRRVKYGAHRAAWLLTFGNPIPDHVCHRCDTRLCCNPAHLFAGTAQINMDDMWAKGRGKLGEAHPQARATEEAVRDIRANAVPGSKDRNFGVFARKWNLSNATVEMIWHRKTWQHVEATRPHCLPASVAAFHSLTDQNGVKS